MDRLWAPWRAKYINSKVKKGCIFCIAAKSKKDRENFIVYRSRLSFAILNIYPYNNGHVMIAPYRHINDINKLSEDEAVDMFRLLSKTKDSLDEVLKKPHGYNIGVNIGSVAGAGFEGHVHIHIVPRWKADTNFMSSIAGTKVISESLITLYKKLKKNARD